MTPTIPLDKGQEESASEAATLALEKSGEYTHIVALSHALFAGWKVSFGAVLETHDVLEVESEFCFDLLNPETEAPSRTFVEAGKIDGILRHRASGIIKTLEHKTTSDSISPESSYWPRLIMDSQVSKYILACKSRGLDASSVLYDVVSKPAQRPRAIPLLDDQGFKIVLDAGDNRVKTADGKKWRESGDSGKGYTLQTREESPAEYHERVRTEIFSDIPGYFSQREIPRSDESLLEYMQDAWSLSQQILYFRRAKLWPRNPSACVAFGTCEFFDLCSGRASVDGIRFAKKAKRHAELDGVETTKGFLTNSRISAIRKCSRYHFLKYEEPVEPVGPPSDALRIGTLFHAACESYLKTFIVSK
jgi:hypothetical protein